VSDQLEKSEETLASDLLRGARRIGEFIGATEDQVYYLHRSRKWPIGKLGKDLIASKTRLASHARKITAGS
jgi:hypothetical protein